MTLRRSLKSATYAAGLKPADQLHAQLLAPCSALLSAHAPRSRALCSPTRPTPAPSRLRQVDKAPQSILAAVRRGKYANATMETICSDPKIVSTQRGSNPRTSCLLPALLAPAESTR